MVDRLLAAGADVDALTNDHWTPLHEAALNGHVETVNRLLKAGAQVCNSPGDLWRFCDRDLTDHEKRTQTALTIVAVHGEGLLQRRVQSLKVCFEFCLKHCPAHFAGWPEDQCWAHTPA